MLLQLLALLGMVGLVLLLSLAWVCTEVADEAALEILPDRRWLTLIEACQRPMSPTPQNHTV